MLKAFNQVKLKRNKTFFNFQTKLKAKLFKIKGISKEIIVKWHIIHHLFVRIRMGG